MEKNILNNFMVKVFNEINKIEEKNIDRVSDERLSLKEIHVIEAVFSAFNKNQNTMGEVAKLLSVTLGTLTVSVKTLQKKGFLKKTKSKSDKRVVYILPTPLAKEVYEAHQKFHNKMIESVIANFDERENELLNKLLLNLIKFFEKENKN